MFKKIILSIGIFFWIASISVASDKPTKLVPTDGNMRPVAVQYIQNDDGTYSKIDSGTPLPVSGSFSLTGTADIGDISKGMQTNDVKITLDGEEITETNSSDIKTAVEALDTSVLLTETIFTGRIGEIQATPTANTLLARLKVIADNQLVDGHNVTIDNASLAVTVTSGAITETNSGTIAGDTTSIDGKIITCNTGAVTISAALPTGSNAIGKLAANDAVDIGDVTINNASGASAVNIQDGGNALSIDFSGTQPTAVTRDSAYSTEAVGLPLLGIFDDVSPDTVEEGDAVSLRTDNTGIQYIKISDGSETTNVDASGNLMVTLGENIAGEDISNNFLMVGGRIADDAAVATTNPLAIGAVANPTDAAVEANDIGFLAMDLNRNLKVVLASNDGVDIGNVDIASIAAGTNYIGNVRLTDGSNDITTVVRDSGYSLIAAGLPLLGIFDDTSSDTVEEGDAVSIRTDSSGRLYSRIVDSAGDAALVDGSGNLMTNLGMKIAGEDITNDYLKVGGSIAEDAVANASMFPVLVGGRYDNTPRSLDDTDIGAIALDADGAVHIADGDNAITVDWAGTAPPIGAGTEAAALRVTLATDSTGVVSVDDNGGSLTVDVANIGTAVPTHHNVTMVDADTQYTQALSNVKSIMFQCRGNYDVRYAFVDGKVATPIAPYMTLKAGAVYSEEFLDGVVDYSLYIATGVAGQIVEIEVK